MRLSAYSTTTMAPSTSIPTARIRPNMTMFEIETPITARKAKQSRKEVGIAKPTSRAARLPREARTTIITSATAVRTEPSSWLTMEPTTRLWSLEVPRVTEALSSGGHLVWALVRVSFTRSTVSIRLKPLRFTTCKATVSSPLKRAVPSRSSKVKLISANSPRVTMRSPLVLTGSP